MERAGQTALLCTLAALGACGAGGPSGTGGGRGAQGLTGSLVVLGHAPADGAVEVPASARVQVRLDGAVVPDSLLYADTGLFAGGEPVPGAFQLESGGTELVFVPSAPLPEETQHELRLSPLTADGAGRILDRPFSFSFRTVDRRPPAVSGASVSPGQTGASRTAAIDVELDEDLLQESVSPANVLFRDEYGATTPAEPRVLANKITATPAVDLAGDRGYTLELRGGAGGVSDLAGNVLLADWSVAFRTAPDTTPPSVLWSAPSGASASPLAHVRLTFDESIEPASIEPWSIVLIDEHLSFVPFDVVPSADRRSIRLAPRTPLTPGRAYQVSVAAGFAALTDVSGNPVARLYGAGFAAGADVTPPAPSSTWPMGGATRVAVNAEPTVAFAEPLDPASVSADTVALLEGTAPVAAAVDLDSAASVITVRPAARLAPGRRHRLVVRGGYDGVLDAAGNPLAADFELEFHTTDDETLPAVALLPADGNSGVPYTARLTALFDAPIDPASVDDSTVFCLGPGGAPVPGTLAVERSDRVVRFEPAAPWQPGDWYTLTVAGGPQGVREPSGNHLTVDQSSTFRISSLADTVGPVVTVTLNSTAEERHENLTMPPSGFVVDVSAFDPQHYSLDMSTVQVSLAGPGPVPGAEAVFAGASVDGSSLRYALPEPWALSPGRYRLLARVADLSGNTGSSAALEFRVEHPDDGALPFERTQLVWVRFDLDRDRNGRPDGDDDLLRLGFMTPGDPAGTNAHVRRVLQDGILARCHDAFGRTAAGTPAGTDSVPVRLVAQQPLGVAHAAIACAGMDPAGDPSRVFGAPTTGTLGRAFFDYRNANVADQNTATKPALGVFPAEIFFFEAAIHLQVFPSYVTTFGSRFTKLCPQMGGTPAGAHALDATVLSPAFEYSTASAAQQARYEDVFRAADDWASAVGVVLAHEIGHAVGLVAAGGNPLGLHGDASLHDELPPPDAIMAATLSYDSMVLLDYLYRDLDLAYLRQRLLMK